MWGGFTTTDTTGADQGSPRVILTNGTTITANRDTSASTTITVYITVVEFTSAAMATPVQYGSITMNSVATNTATISAVTLNNAAIMYLGQQYSGTTFGSNAYSSIELTNSTTVTTSRDNSGGTVIINFCVVNFNPAILNSSVQRRSVTLSTNGTSINDTITSVATGQTMLWYGGFQSGVSGSNSAIMRLSLTNGTTVNLARSGTSTSTRIYKYCVVEFTSAVIQSIQRGTIAVNSTTSNTATVSSVNTAKAWVTELNFSTDNSSSTTLSSVYGSLALTNATTVTARRDTAGVINQTLSYEVIEFK